MIDPTPPVAYLTSNPGEEEVALAEQVGLHTGAGTPFWMLARVAAKVHSIAAWAATRRRRERRLGRLAWAVAGAAVANLSAVGITVLNHTREAGVAQERAADLGRRVDELGQQIAEIRSAMLRSSGVDPFAPRPGGAFDIEPPQLTPNKLSLHLDAGEAAFCSFADR